MMFTVDLPDELLIYKDRIESTIKPCIEITAQPARDLRLWQSKFGGLPYFPKNLPYPIDSQGQVMVLLAQINFKETPQLNPFPATGILQFYIANSRDTYGASFENPLQQDDFRIIYFAEVIEDEEYLTTDFAFLPTEIDIPVAQPSSLGFSLKYAPMSISDHRFEKTILNITAKKYELLLDYESVYEAYERLFPSEGHKLGGYPYFTQDDPRELEPYQGIEYMLLFQMDSDDRANILWGDYGVANFFITEQDLTNRNFASVFYNWDCS